MKTKKQCMIGVLLAGNLCMLSQVTTLQVQTLKNPATYGDASVVKDFLSANGGTTDLFSKTATKKDLLIPDNYMGSQAAVSGDAYFGIFAYYADGTFDLSKALNDGAYAEKEGYSKYSEYIELPLGTKLKAGSEYVVSYKVSLSDKSAYALAGLGAYLSTEPVHQASNARLTVDPQVSDARVINDKNGWTEVSGRFKAKGDENYITIGCFNKNMKVEKVISDKEMNNRRAYYYVGDIKLEEYRKPDTDQDGIPDEADKCPTVKGIEKFAGCPDSDNDGIEDSKDKCPTVAGIEKFEGCPDTDNDGIEDSKDKCPTVAGVASNNGCPEVKINSKAKEVFQKAMSGIQFETGKDVIKTTSYPVLDNVATVLKENPEWTVEIQGHTDNVGDPAKNKALSHKRAEAVERYLVSKGIADSRLTPMGYGQERPIADNKTPAGRAKNRRVEFNVTYIQ